MEIFLSETKFNFKRRKVLLRIDADVDLTLNDQRQLVVDEDFRLRSVLPTINFLQRAGVKNLILLGHLGRPQGKRVAGLSLKPVADWFLHQGRDCRLIKWSQLDQLGESFLSLLENLRFNPAEEDNEERFSRKLASLADAFVNDAFAVSHRSHASVVGLPQFLPSFLGLRFEGEVKTLSWLKKNCPRPLVFVLGGSKKGKLDYIKFLIDWADWLLVGGKLPSEIKSLTRKKKNLVKSQKLILGKLKRNQKDITKETIKKFISLIKKGRSIVWAGPMGVYEEKGNRKGSFALARAIAASEAFKVAGGGDTHRILSWTRLWREFDFVSVGGGAMLQFLRDGTLPGIEAIKNSPVDRRGVKL